MSIVSLLQDSKFQRKVAVALAAFLALFSSKVPFLADVNPDNIQYLIGALAVWVAQSGAHAAMQAHAEGQKAAALIANADDAVAVFNQVSGPKQADVVPAASAPIAAVPK